MHPGHLIRLRRKKLGLTQSELAQRCNINRSSIIKIEQGEPILQRDWFEKIGREIKYSPEKLKNSYEVYFDKNKEAKTPQVRLLSESLKKWSFEEDLQEIEQLESEEKTDRWSFSKESSLEEEKPQGIQVKFLSDYFKESSFYMEEDARTDWISAFINRTDSDHEIFKGAYSLLSDYRNGRIIIERFQLAIHLLCLALEEHDYSIKKIKVSSYKLDSMLDDWKKKKKNDSISNDDLIRFYVGTLKAVKKNYSKYLIGLVLESPKMYWLSSNALHLYELGNIDTQKMDMTFEEELDNFNEQIERMYVATDFIMNVLNNVSVYEIIEDYKISEHLRERHPEDLITF